MKRPIQPILLPLIILSVVAACAKPDNTPQGVCARRAESDPAVQRLVMLSGTNTPLEVELRPRLKEARRQATNRCLATMGLAPPGSVQSPNAPLP
jgi:hypothetical protein